MSEGLSLSGGEVEEDQEEEVEVSLWQAVEPLSSGLPDSEPAGRCGHGETRSSDHCSSYTARESCLYGKELDNEDNLS